MLEPKKISFELKTKLVENQLYIRLTDFEIVMNKILNVEQENEKLKNKNEQLKEQIEKMKNCDNCKNLLQCTNRRYEKMTSGKMTKIRFPCCWEIAE